jgi:thymidylate kinase
MPHCKFIIEGIDHLGKSTLIQAMRQELGNYLVIHNTKPEKLKCYETSPETAAQDCQIDMYHNYFHILNSDAFVIMDRGHLGEPVYAQRYRGYDGNYVFNMELKYHTDSRMRDIRMILLTEDFTISKHFKDDGLSLDVTKREEEQNDYIAAFNKSSIKNKQIVCVTGPDGQFRPREEILKEVIQLDMPR